MQGIVGYRHRSHGVGVKARPNHAASASVDLISLLLRDRLPRRAPVRQHGIQSNHLSLPWSPLPLRSPQVFVSRAAPNSKSRRSAGSSLLPRSVLKRPASSSTLSASTGSVCLFTSSPFYCFLSLALASRHVNCLLAQLQPCQIHLPSNTRLLLGQCAARGLLHSPIPLMGSINSSSSSSILLPHTEYASNILDISIVLNKDFLQERLELVRYVLSETRLPLRAHRCTKTVLTGPLEHHPTLSRFFAKRRELSQLSQNFTLLSRDLRPRKKNKILRKRRLLARQER